MINLHPPATAFPFSFVILLALLEWYRFFRPGEKVRFACEISLAAFGIGVLLAFFSGYHGSEFADLSQPALADAVSTHHTYGKILLFACIPLVLFGFLRSRAERGKKQIEIAYYKLLAICLFLTLYTGYLGGELVFQHGAGVVTNQP